QLIFQIGSNEGHNMIAGIDDMSAKALGITDDSLDVTNQNVAERTIMVIDGAIHKVSSQRALLGAVQNRLEHTISNLGVAEENLTAAESRIRDADMAKQMHYHRTYCNYSDNFDIHPKGQASSPALFV
ncbi:MAG: flagellin, partial [Thermotogaceae bacterium]|nr:flagellin [Thermotogaceae bacterium]